MKIKVNDEDIFEGPALVFVGNISTYAVGLHILKEADYSDGLLDLCIYKCSSRIHLVKHSIWTVLKQHSKASDVIYMQAKKITHQTTGFTRSTGSLSGYSPRFFLGLCRATA